MIIVPYTPPAWLITSGIATAVLTMVGVVIRMIGPWRKQISETEEKLRKELLDERRRCEAELRLVRHRERGSRQIIYSLLHVAGLPSGAKRDGALESIRATLVELERVEAEELKHSFDHAGA
jgi:hypothetical protein